MVGADVAQVRALAASFERAAEQLEQTSKRVRSGIQLSAWVGPFAVRFRRLWESEHSVKINRVATDLRAQAKKLRLEADQQEQASAHSALRYASGRVSDRDLVHFALSATSDKDPITKNGFTPLSTSELLALGIDPEDLRDERSGFDAKIYRDGSGRIIVAFGGTEDADDQATDVAGANPFVPTGQGKQSVELGQRLVKQFGVDEVILTGHSLGGRNAAIAAVATGSRAVTFNAAGVGGGDYAYAARAGGSTGLAAVQAGTMAAGIVASMAIRGPLAGLEGGVRLAPNVTNYSTVTDLLTVAQLGTSLPNAVGEQHFIPTVNPFSHSAWEEIEAGTPD